MRVICHIVTWNSAGTISKCLSAVSEVETIVTDNASTDETCAVVSKYPSVTLIRNGENSGFSAAHNSGIAAALKAGADAVLILNPDATPTPGAIAALTKRLAQLPNVGAVTPKILRCDASFAALIPHTFDAAGMYLTTEFRHFDRGSSEEDRGQFDSPEFVFGGTGAALLLTRRCIEEIGPEVFDEDFFAYREDADLSFRLQRMGWRVLYEPDAVFYHVRRVVPENRNELPERLNALSVRNRFLLQWKNFSFSAHWRAVPQMILRNLIVIVAVLTVERSSLPALGEALRLFPKMLKKRSAVKSRVTGRELGRWLEIQGERIPE